MQRLFSLPKQSHGAGVVYFEWQQDRGNYLATTGRDQTVRLYDRKCQVFAEIPLPGVCTSFGWDNDGDVLAIVCDQSDSIYLYDTNTQKTSRVESGLKDSMQFVMWSKLGQLVAAGTTKGNVLLYNHQTFKRIPILAKHRRAVTCGAWSGANHLALGSKDKTFSISTTDGYTITQGRLQHEPSLMKFARMGKEQSSVVEENALSFLVGKRTLYLYDLEHPSDPVELSFLDMYGDICTYEWYGAGLVMLGFSQGYLVSISTDKSEMGQELFHARIFRSELMSISVCQALGLAALCGDNSIRTHNLRDLREVEAIVPMESERGLHRLAYTQDGQLLAVSTLEGNLHVSITNLPRKAMVSCNRIAHLTSLTEITLNTYIPLAKRTPAQAISVKVNVDIEPQVMGIGPFHLAVGMNNRVSIYKLVDTGAAKLYEREYLATVDAIYLNAQYAAALTTGKVLLHTIQTSTTDFNYERESRLFPEDGETDVVILSYALTEELLIYGTDAGELVHFHMAEWDFSNKYRHDCGIAMLVSNELGTRLAMVDTKGRGYIFNPVNNTLLEIPQFPPCVTGIFWDMCPTDKGTFIVFDNEVMKTYMYYRDHVGKHVYDTASEKQTSSSGSLQTALVVHVGNTRTPTGYLPIMMYDGEINLLMPNGKLYDLHLTTHYFLTCGTPENRSKSTLENCAVNCTKLRRFKEAWRFCELLDKAETWNNLGKVAMQSLDIDFAIQVYRHLRNVGMVMSLKSINNTDDKYQLMGDIASFLGETDLAQDFFLHSGNPVAAVQMRVDLMQWESALVLARALEPSQVPSISLRYAQDLEFTCRHRDALVQFQSGLSTEPKLQEHNEACRAGIARMTLRCGEIVKGLELAAKLPSLTAKKDCASILESMRLWSEAAKLYEEAEQYDKAAYVLIKSKNMSKIAPLIPKITSLKILSQYAKSREAEGHYQEAVQVYKMARDWISVIRVNLDHIRDTEEAVKVARETKSVDGAKLVAQFFQKLGDIKSAIQFLVISQCKGEAFRMAVTHHQMEIFAEAIGSEASSLDLQAMAYYFAEEKNLYMAGKCYFECGEYEKAMKYLVKCGENSEAIDVAIQTAKAASSELLTQQLFQYLTGEEDKIEKDPKYQFRTYLALERYKDATHVAGVISQKEQNLGNFRNAHDVLFHMHQELKAHQLRIPSTMKQGLALLHSYVIVKLHIKKGDHMKGARMLIRVANNISKFEFHTIPILTSTVIECYRANLRFSAFTHATTLMRPEYRCRIEERYKSKIELIVRKQDKTEEEEPLTPCAACSLPLPESDLVCPTCKVALPYCIITGRHILRDDLTACPKCDFPAILSEFNSFLEKEESCPMCYEKVTKEELKKIANADKYLAMDEGQE